MKVRVLMQFETPDGMIYFENIDGTLIVSEEGYGSPYGKQVIIETNLDEFVTMLKDIELTEKDEECNTKT